MKSSLHSKGVCICYFQLEVRLVSKARFAMRTVYGINEFLLKTGL